MSAAKHIIAVNTDKDAPIFEAAQYGIVGDAMKVLPKLVEAVKDLKKYSPVFETDVFTYMDLNNALNTRKTTGAASFKEVARQINEEKIYCNL